jgi:hypothetical protein
MNHRITVGTIHLSSHLRLTNRAKMGAALPYAEMLNDSITNRAGLTSPTIYAEMILKIAAPVYPIDAGAILFNAFGQNLPDRRQEFSRFIHRQGVGPTKGMNFGQVQGFITVNIPDPGQEVLV